MSLKTLMSRSSTSTSPDKNFSSTDSDPNFNWRPYQDLNEADLTTLKKIRLKIFFVVSNPMFEFAVTAFIFFNTLCLSLEYHGMNPFFKEALIALNHVSIECFVNHIFSYTRLHNLCSKYKDANTGVPEYKVNANPCPSNVTKLSHAL